MNSIFAQFDLSRDRESGSTVHDEIASGATLRSANLWILVCAIFIASLGLNLNSTAVVIGAMLISPLMGPIIAFGFGLATNDRGLIAKAGKNFGFAFVTSLATSSVYFLLTPISDPTAEMIVRTSPTVYDVLIAFFGGVAGFLAVSSKSKGNVIPGVAIATALMPPLCTAGYGLAKLDLAFLGGALYLFFINSVIIALSTLLMAKVMNFSSKSRGEDAAALSMPVIVLIVVATVLPSIYFAYDVVQRQDFKKRANAFVNKEANFPNDYLLQRNIDAGKREISLVFGGDPIHDDAIENVRSKLPEYGLGDVKLMIGLGFAYEQDTSGLDKAGVDRERLASLISSQDLRIKTLEGYIDQQKNAETEASRLLVEVKAVYPQIDGLTVADVANTSPEPDAAKRMVEVTSKTNLNPETRGKIDAWLKARLSTATLDVRFVEVK